MLLFGLVFSYFGYSLFSLVLCKLLINQQFKLRRHLQSSFSSKSGPFPGIPRHFINAQCLYYLVLPCICSFVVCMHYDRYEIIFCLIDLYSSFMFVCRESIFTCGWDLSHHMCNYYWSHTMGIENFGGCCVKL